MHNLCIHTPHRIARPLLLVTLVLLRYLKYPTNMLPAVHRRVQQVQCSSAPHYVVFNALLCTVQETEHALDALEAAVSLSQHHDAITGTSKQHVANDYALRLSNTMHDAYAVLSKLLKASIFTPNACTPCKHADDGHNTHGPQEASVQTRDVDYLRGDQGLSERSESDQPPSGSVPSSTHERHAWPLGELPDLAHCEYSNISMCEVTVEASRRCEEVIVVLFNSASWQRTQRVRVRYSST